MFLVRMIFKMSWKSIKWEIIKIGRLAKIGHNAALAHCIKNDEQIPLVALNSLISTNFWGNYFNEMKVASQQWKHLQMKVRFLC